MLRTTILLGLAFAAFVWIARKYWAHRRAAAIARSGRLAVIDRELAAGADAGALIEASLLKARRLHQRAQDRARRVLAGFSIVTEVAEVGTAIDRYRRTRDPADDLLRARDLAARAEAAAIEAETQYAQRTGRAVQFIGTWWLSGGGSFD